MTRIGVYLDAGSEEYVVKNQYNTTLNGMLYAILYSCAIFCRFTWSWSCFTNKSNEPQVRLMTRKLNIIIVRIKPPDPSLKPVGFKARQEAKLGLILDKVYSDLQSEKEQSICKLHFNNLYMHMQYAWVCAGLSIIITACDCSLFLLADEQKPLRLLVKVDKPIPRPPTPTVVATSDVREMNVWCMYILWYDRMMRNKIWPLFYYKDLWEDVSFRIR